MLEWRELKIIAAQFKEAWDAIQSLKPVYLNPLNVKANQRIVSDAFRTFSQLNYVKEMDQYRMNIETAYFGLLALEHPNYPQSSIAFSNYLKVLDRVGLKSHVRKCKARWLFEKAMDSKALQWIYISVLKLSNFCNLNLTCF